MVKWKTTLEQTEHLEADIVGLCETSINWSKNATLKNYKDVLKKKFKKNAMVVSTIHKLTDRVHLPGGTATLTLNNTVNRIERIIKDKYDMGRWTGNTYRLGDGRKLNVITAYRVIEQKITSRNSMSTSSQQHHLLQLRGIKDTKPRTQFRKDFIEQFREQCMQPNE
jgi:hypothetical protein